MNRSAFCPMLIESALEARLSPSGFSFKLGGVPVIAVGSAVNPALFNGLVQKQVNGRWYDAVFDNGHRVSPWALMRHPLRP
jgi:hypothetical protein